MLLDAEQNSIAQFFDDCALQGFMREFTPEECGKLPAFLERWDIRPGHRVLEPGCGSGRLTPFLSRAAGREGAITAIDLSPEMARQAARVGAVERGDERTGQAAPVQVLLGSVYALPSADRSFDRVICCCVFPHFTRRLAALREMARVLKPDGRLWISHFVGRQVLDSFHRDAHPDLIRHTLPCAREMGRLLKAAGLEAVEVFDGDDEYQVQAKGRE
ncbi:class I SAM-dependent methyltransferase [bacterium]|nr:class I SAM-dependent methyltransferase [bacterium]